MGVCRRVLSNEQDAEDAFQATFLVLARKAGSWRRARSLSAWLHKAAYRIALRARAMNARRREQPLEGRMMIGAETLSEITSNHDRSILDQELNRLPDQYHLPLFLCCVQDMSRDEAARRLGCSLGSLKGRLERGRQLFRRRLMRRGVSLGTALTLLIRTQHTAEAAVTPSLVASTVQAGVQYATGQTVVGYVSQNALSLARWSLHVMSLTTAKSVLCSLMVVGLLTWGVAWLSPPAIAGGDPVQKPGLVLQTGIVRTSEPETLVTFLAAEQGDRPRQSPEAEAGARRSPEAAAGRRRLPEAEAGPGLSAEGEVMQAAEGFRPQTDREAVLYRMILQLERDVLQLRKELQARTRTRDRMHTRDADTTARRDLPRRDPAPVRDPAYNKLSGVFQTYDKGRNNRVSFEEFLAMREGTEDPRVQAQARGSFQQADRNGARNVSFEEFVAARQRGEGGDQPRLEGDAPREGGQMRPRDGEGERRGPRDREGEFRRRG